MSRFKDNVQMYWPLVIGVLLFIPAAWKYYSLGQWEAQAGSAAVAVLGLVSMLAPDEVASWTGRYGWTYDSFWNYPPTYVRFFGLALQIGLLVFGFR